MPEGRKGFEPIHPQSRWQDKVGKTFYTVLLLPARGEDDKLPRQVVVALAEDGNVVWFEVEYWHQEMQPAGKPEGQRFALPAPLPV